MPLGTPSAPATRPKLLEASVAAPTAMPSVRAVTQAAQRAGLLRLNRRRLRYNKRVKLLSVIFILTSYDVEDALMKLTVSHPGGSIFVSCHSLPVIAPTLPWW